MFRKFINSLAFGIPIGITFFDCVGYVARVDGVSMQPTLNPDASETDYVFLCRLGVRTQEMPRGTIVSLLSPKDPSQKIIKRLVGLQGDVIQTIGYKEKIVRIPEGHCWIEGDYTGHSYDSNSFGAVPLGLLTARATFIVWPPNRFGPLSDEIPAKRRSAAKATASDYVRHSEEY